jgi:predicted permease
MTPRDRRFFRFPWRSRRQIESEIDDELDFHLAMRAQELSAGGVADSEARRRAEEEFGDIDLTRSYCRTMDQRTEDAIQHHDRMSAWWQDLRQAWRAIRRNPAFASIALLTLMLAIGANTAVFSVTRAVLLRPLPYGNPGALVSIAESPRRQAGDRNPLSAPNFADYSSSQHSLTGMAAWYSRSVTWRPSAGDPELLDILSVTPNTFEVLERAPQLGRAFAPDDARPGAPPVAILSWRFWQSSLDGDPGIIGRTITLNDLPYTVLGVMPKDFVLGNGIAMWAPFDLQREIDRAEITRKQFILKAIGRLRPGVTLDAAATDLAAISTRLSAQYPEADADRTASLVPLREAMVGDLKLSLLLLEAASALVLLIACVNLANVTLSRTMARRREMALRAALGAGRGRLIRQLLTESVLLAVVGGGLGVGLAMVVTRLLLAVEPGALPRTFEVKPDLAVLLFGLIISVATGIGFGLLPAIDAARADLQGALKEGGRGTSGGPRGERIGRALVVTQVSIAVVLVIAAGLLLRSFAGLLRVPLGFDSDHVLTAEVRVSGERYDSVALVNRFYDRVLQQIRQSPDVISAGATMKLPASGWISSGITVEGEPVESGRITEVGFLLARGDYFKTLHIPLLAGRSFDDRDAADAPGAVLVNQAAVKAFFPHGDPVGRRIRLGPDPNSPWSVVIGVVGDVREKGIAESPVPAVYPNHVQNTWWRSLVLVVRTRGDPQAAAPIIRQAVRDADPTLAVRNVRTLEDVLGLDLAARRFALGLITGFAAVALLLAAVGIYGVLAFSVSSRTREFGVRLALGATRGSVLMLVLKRGLLWSAIGLGIGLAGALAAGRLLESRLFGVGSADLATFVTVSVAFLLVVTVACLAPAARATRIDPMTTMRSD